MRILVTGGAGYIGSELCEKLTRNPDYEVHAVDNCMWGTNSVLHLLNRKNFSFERADMREVEYNYNTIIWLGALVGAPLCDKNPKETIDINYLSVERLCQKAPKDTKILFPTTNSAYGISKDICTEESPLHPLSLYAKTKGDAEKVILDRGNSCSFRLATVFGCSARPRMDLMVNDFVYQIYFNGKMSIFEPHFKRNFVHVADVCRAFIFGLNPSIEGCFNLGLDSANCTKMELAQRVKSIVNPNATIEVGQGVDPDQRDYNVSSQKIINHGFTFKNSLEDGIAQVHKMCQIVGPNIRTNRNY